MKLFVNYRIVCFLTTKGELVYKIGEATEKGHRNLKDELEAEGLDLEYENRWCGFLVRISGNDSDHIILYGESSDYSHRYIQDFMCNEYEDEDIEYVPSLTILSRLRSCIEKDYKTYTIAMFENNYSNKLLDVIYTTDNL